jgi:hypothetical protein
VAVSARLRSALAVNSRSGILQSANARDFSVSGPDSHSAIDISASVSAGFAPIHLPRPGMEVTARSALCSCSFRSNNPLNTGRLVME